MWELDAQAKLFEVCEAMDVECFMVHFGGPTEEKVSGLEGCYVANPYFNKLDALRDRWIFT